MTATALIPDIEVLAGAYLRDHPDVSALDARVAPQTPNTQTAPWVRLTQLDAKSLAEPLDHLIEFYLQLDCYASKTAQDAHAGQAEASLLARTVRAAVKAMPRESFDGTVVTGSKIQSMPRIPDTDFEPARERFILNCLVWAHVV